MFTGNTKKEQEPLENMMAQKSPITQETEDLTTKKNLKEEISMSARNNQE